MRFAAKHQGSRGRSAPALRGSGPVQNPLRSPRMGRRPDGESPQLTLVEEVAKNDRHPHSDRISDYILLVGVRAGGVPTVRVTGPCTPTGVRTAKGPGLGRAYAVRWAAGSGRPVGGEPRDLRAMVLSTARGSCCAATPRRLGRPSQVGGLEGPRRSSAQLLDDANAHRPRSIRRVLAKDSEGGDVHLSPLQGRGGHGAAHSGILSSVGRTAPYLATRHRREFGSRDRRRGDAEGAPGVHRRSLLLRASYAREEASGAG